ncbi:MAG: hypothetical protein COU09_02920 [Candidatus Harrisonbacteria bacterium CG10_big_fil_rev_8_21_14_0_10_44_23]|uniref:Excinuclease ABC subunit C n=1 Tax=Candidatus Harrisonbacteria bacterium CG10_big_fil_rev_8_21_14_0_10_44_23 TaxID=1974585 RepID=A0A2H0UPH0_9BACT|nr:MAG: hypothetical protein COU09_02920 [Candidatus Harrisonbacteria bacterium CG10_big_fil_rev_8_21_14_0_10_44_23]
MPQNTLKKLKVKASSAPKSPGVYFFRRRRIRPGRRFEYEPIYIGRATKLKDRISSYFNAKDPRVKEMVATAHDLKWQKTDTLLESVILEANLIKKYQPKYNIREKDNKSFTYLVFLKQGQGPELTKGFPKPLIVRGRELAKYSAAKNSEIFGPYKSYYILRTVLKILRPIFPYSTCRAGAKRPCFHYQIGLCPGVCVGKADKKEYNKNIRNLILLLKGEKKRLYKSLKAVGDKDTINALNHVNDVALLTQSSSSLLTANCLPELHLGKAGSPLTRVEGYDISHLRGKEAVGAMVVFESAEPNPDQYRLFKIRGEKTQSDVDSLKEVLDRRLKHKEWPYPDILFVDGGLAQVRIMKAVLTLHNLKIPVVGLSKAGKHAASAARGDKMIVQGIKPESRDLIASNKRLFQKVRDEAHRFSIKASRRQRTQERII